MKFGKPNAQQQRWREEVREHGSVISGRSLHTQIHHPAGRTAKHDKIPIGHAFVLPLAPDEHRLIDTGRDGLELLKFDYAALHPDTPVNVEPMSLHEFEKWLFARMCLKVKFPFSDDCYWAIQRWHR